MIGLKENQVIEIAKNYLSINKIKYTNRAFKPRFKQKEDIGDGVEDSVWIVPYEYTIFQDEVAYVYISDTSGEILFDLTKHGRRVFD